MGMREKFESFKARYERFLKDGSEDPLMLKADAERLLAEAKQKAIAMLLKNLKTSL